jgi:hypothetical protein
MGAAHRGNVRQTPQEARTKQPYRRPSGQHSRQLLSLLRKRVRAHHWRLTASHRRCAKTASMSFVLACSSEHRQRTKMRAQDGSRTLNGHEACQPAGGNPKTKWAPYCARAAATACSALVETAHARQHRTACEGRAHTRRMHTDQRDETGE